MEENKEGMIYVNEETYNKIIAEIEFLRNNPSESKKYLNKLLLAYGELEKAGIIEVLSKLFSKDDISIMSLMAPIGKIIPKIKKFEDNEAINNVFNQEFFENAKKAAL